jgi:Uncharacterized phage-associated protein
VEVVDAARYVVYLSYHLNKYSLTPLKLQKILYFAQGWNYVWQKKPLFSESFAAWQYGPVNRTVYQYFKAYKGMEIPECEGISRPPATESELATLRAVWKYYGPETAACLVEMTHQEKPWQDAVAENRDIDNNEIRCYFLQHA